MLVAGRNYDAMQTAAQGRASIPPSVGGLNYRDELADMDPRDAILLDNIFPGPNYVSLRTGYSSWATGMGTGKTIKTLMEWAGPTTRKMKAAVNGKIYDVSVAGAVGAAEVSGLSVDEWQWQNITTAGGAFLVACNGTDAVRNYDGTTWTSPTITGSGLSSSAAFIGMTMHKSRLWFIEKNTLNAWYLPATSIAGTATKFSFGAVFKLGGALQAIGTLSYDTGYGGMDDYLVVMTSRGEFAVYRGSDVASANTWALVGVFYVGYPIGFRSFVKVGGDIGILCADGVISCTQSMRSDRAAAQRAAITAKIQNLFNIYVSSYQSNSGWMPLVYPQGNWALFNIPFSATEYVQLVMNTITGAWCQFRNMNAFCWGLLGNDIYFGGTNGIVYKADTGFQDNGGVITGNSKTAWNYFGAKGQQKLFTLCRPVIQTNGSPSILFNLNVDFQEIAPTGTIAASAPMGSAWGSATWGSGTWGGDATLVTNWNSPQSLGYCAAVRMTITSNGAKVITNSYDVQMQKGGAL